MIQELARFANDSYRLMRTPHSPGRKAALWFKLFHPTGRLQGFTVSYLDRASYVLLYREIFARQYYFFRAETDAPLIFDCGANIGMATIFFKWLYPKSKIHAFEPDPTTFSALERNISQNQLADVIAHNCALSSDNGQIDFFVNSVPGSLRNSTNGSRSQGAPVKLPKRKLSEFITEPIDFLKMDIEGDEHQVIRELMASGKTTLIRQALIEYHHHIAGGSCLADFLRILEQSGFDYQIHAPAALASIAEQDILIYAQRRVTIPPLSVSP